MTFDYASLSTNVSLCPTIDMIYDNNYINTTLTRNEMKNALTNCANNIHLDFKGDIFVYNNPVTMGSLFAPVLVGIFMVKL